MNSFPIELFPFITRFLVLEDYVALAAASKTLRDALVDEGRLPRLPVLVTAAILMQLAERRLVLILEKVIQYHKQWTPMTTVLLDTLLENCIKMAGNPPFVQASCRIMMRLVENARRERRSYLYSFSFITRLSQIQNLEFRNFIHLDRSIHKEQFV